MKAGVAQIGLCNDIGTNIEKIVSYFKSAASLELDFLCFPECCITGYKRDFRNIAWDEVAQAIDKLQKAVTAEGITIAVGTPYVEAGKVYNAAIVISARHRLKYFKNNLTEFDKLYFAEGKDTLSFEVKGVKCGLIICRDQNDPQLAQEYARAGVKIIFLLAAHYYPPAEARRKLDKNRALPIARAVENGLFVAKANAVGFQDDHVSLGHSMIVDPEGSVVCEANEKEERLLYHDL
ncbi:MAG: carbon-nitrogen hydrolase family protein [Chloroflexota bacterium]